MCSQGLLNVAQHSAFHATCLSSRVTQPVLETLACSSARAMGSLCARTQSRSPGLYRLHCKAWTGGHDTGSSQMHLVHEQCNPGAHGAPGLAPWSHPRVLYYGLRLCFRFRNSSRRQSCHGQRGLSQKQQSRSLSPLFSGALVTFPMVLVPALLLLLFLQRFAVRSTRRSAKSRSLQQSTVCTPPQQPCGAYCANLTTDINNCGKCSNFCDIGSLCCNGKCVDGSSNQNCGACGMVCVKSQCIQGTCGYGS